MKAILITKDLKRIEIEVNSYDTGVIIRNDSRKNPPLRVFHFVSQPHFSHNKPPEFYETDIEYVGEEGLHDDVFSDYFKQSVK